MTLTRIALAAALALAVAQPPAHADSRFGCTTTHTAATAVSADPDLFPPNAGTVRYTNSCDFWADVNNVIVYACDLGPLGWCTVEIFTTWPPVTFTCGGLAPRHCEGIYTGARLGNVIKLTVSNGSATAFNCPVPAAGACLMVPTVNPPLP